MDQTERDMDRFKQPAMAVAGGIAAALVIATLPHVYLENIVGATGLSEFVPAAAPPLGNTARGLIAVMTGMISTSAIYLFLNHTPKFLGGGSDMSLAIRKNLTTNTIDDVRGGKSRFTVPKLNLSAKSLTKFLKKPKKVAGQVTDLRDLPDIKPADGHPDAPARHPIFASSDLGTPLAATIKKFDQAAVEQDLAEPVEKSEPLISSGAPFATDKTADSPAKNEMTVDPVDNVSPQEEHYAPREDLTAFSLDQLAARLEAGLRRLEALEKRGKIAPPAPVAEPAPIVEKTVSLAEVPQGPAPLEMPPLRAVESDEPVAHDNRHADMDAALKAALGTLEKMTVQR